VTPPLTPAQVQKRVADLLGIGTSFVDVRSTTPRTGRNDEHGQTTWTVTIKMTSLDQNLRQP
jgi:hypothetical protein